MFPWFFMLNISDPSQQTGVLNRKVPFWIFPHETRRKPQGPWRGLPRMRCHQRYRRSEAFKRRWLAAVQGSEVSLVMIQWSPSKSTKTIRIAGYTWGDVCFFRKILRLTYHMWTTAGMQSWKVRGLGWDPKRIIPKLSVVTDILGRGSGLPTYLHN